jgi:hypothetical protein
MATGNGQYITIGSDPKHGMTVWWDQKNPDSIHLTTDDPRWTDENGERFGLRVVFSANPRSADYNPANFNRCARALVAAGKAAPVVVPVHSRKLVDRAEVIAELAAQPLTVSVTCAKNPAGPVDPAAYGWTDCPDCRAVVVDKAAHVCPAG